MAMILEHVGITVNDLNKSIDFYTKVFGFRLLRKTPTSAYLYLDNELLELMQSDGPAEMEKPRTPEGWERHMSGAVGLRHLGFRVDDLDEAVENLKKLGGELIAPPEMYRPTIEFLAEASEDKLRRVAKPANTNGWRIAMFCDPDGVILEILER